MDVSQLSLADLKQLYSDLPKIISQREKAELASAKKELEALAASRGFTLDELLSGSIKEAKTRAPVAAKYKNQETGETWTGRGRTPKWLTGKNLDDLKI